MEWHGIVAKDLQNAIGVNGKLPWHLSSELKHFKNLTLGHAIVIGRTTFESFKSALPGRDNLVLSKNQTTSNPPVYYFSDKKKLIDFCQEKKYQKVFVCGGASIYNLFRMEISTWHITQVQLKVDHADTFFSMDELSKFKLVETVNHKDEKTTITWQYQRWIK